MGWLLAIFPGRLWIYLAVALGLYGAGTYSGWQVQSWRQAKNEVYGLKKTIATTGKQITADNKQADERIKTVTVYKQGATKIVEKIVYETITNKAPEICNRTEESLNDLVKLIDSANLAR